jgi:hypothetical protein
VHHPADDESHGKDEEQGKGGQKEAQLVALAMAPGAGGRDGIRRDGSTTGGAETPAVDRISAVATKCHFCY